MVGSVECLDRGRGDAEGSKGREGGEGELISWVSFFLLLLLPLSALLPLSKESEGPKKNEMMNSLLVLVEWDLPWKFKMGVRRKGVKGRRAIPCLLAGDDHAPVHRRKDPLRSRRLARFYLSWR